MQLMGGFHGALVGVIKIDIRDPWPVSGRPERVSESASWQLLRKLQQTLNSRDLNKSLSKYLHRFQ